MIVNWDSLSYLRTTVAAVRRFSAGGTRIIVVDNGSQDGSLAWLRTEKVETVALGANFGHGAGLDLGWLRARTRIVVALDVDAFPISDTWLPRLTMALDSGATVAGAHGGAIVDRLRAGAAEGWDGRDFVHPCCLAMRLRRFVYQRHTFRPDRARRLDTAELISVRERSSLSYLEPTTHLGPGMLGTVFGEAVYHNFYATRHRREGRQQVDGVLATDAETTWARAVEVYLER